MEKRIYEWGNKKNTTLFFLHGLGSTGLSFGELAKYLPEFHIVSFDLPGHGKSLPLSNEEAYRPSKMAQLIKKKMDALNKSDFILVGHSWGAHLAIYFSISYPEFVKGIILLDGGYIQDEIGSLDEELENIEVFYHNVRYPSWESFLESEKAELPRWNKELEVASRAQVKEIDDEIRLATPINTAKAVVKGIFAEPTEVIFAKVKSPVLLLRSTLPEEMENIRQASSNKLNASLGEYEVHAIPNTSHDIYRDAPKEVAEKMKRWIHNNRKVDIHAARHFGD